jgi:hypothetical protein
LRRAITELWTTAAFAPAVGARTCSPGTGAIGDPSSEIAATGHVHVTVRKGYAGVAPRLLSHRLAIFTLRIGHQLIASASAIHASALTERKRQ